MPKLSAVLHSYQPFRDTFDVTHIPRYKKYNGHRIPRSLIPNPGGNKPNDYNLMITKECYEVCANGGVYANIPFNMGPTLLKDLWLNRPDVYEKIIESEKESYKRFGHSNALAQASPNHSILPLLREKEDKILHVLWSINEYEKHFKKFPEGMWLPETAVDKETLEVLAEKGIKYVILEPKQASRFRKVGESHWHDAHYGKNIDTSRTYKAISKDGKEIAVFFYDKGLSANIGYPNESNNWIYYNSENFLERWLKVPTNFKHFAVDGETFGHHHKGKAELLSGVINLVNNHKQGTPWHDAEFTNYGLYLEQNPPEYEVEIAENTAWSCDHYLVRWGQEIKERKNHNEHTWEELIDCNCGTLGSHWRIQMRKAFDDLSENIDGIYFKYANSYLNNPTQAMYDYGKVVSHIQTFDDFLQIHRKGNANIEKIYNLLEMQKFKTYMQTSCGWFHDYIGRIEPFANFIAANSAIRLAKEFNPKSKIEEKFLEKLSMDNRFTKDFLTVYKQAEELNNSPDRILLAA